MISSLLHICFRLFNAALFLGGAGWVFYRKVYHKLVRKVAERKAFMQNLNYNQQLIGRQQEAVKLEYLKQEEEIARLSHLAEKWKGVVARNHEKENLFYQACAEKRDKRLNKQNFFYQRQQSMKGLFPEIYLKVEADLTTKYSNKQEAHKMLKLIIESIDA